MFYSVRFDENKEVRLTSRGKGRLKIERSNMFTSLREGGGEATGFVALILRSNTSGVRVRLLIVEL